MTYKWPNISEKMLNISNHKGNTNQNHSEITSCLLEWLLSKHIRTSIGEDVEKLEHCWRSCKTVYPQWKKVGRFLKTLKIELT